MNEYRINYWKKILKDVPICFKALKETIAYGDEIKEYLTIIGDKENVGSKKSRR